MKYPILIRAMDGLGDSIYARPLIRAAAEKWDVYLITPWPELFEDLDLKLVQSETDLRTQAKNVERNRARKWSVPPPGITRARLRYGPEDLQIFSIMQCMEQILPSSGTPIMDLPDMGPSPVRGTGKPMAVVRPVTVRSEWANVSRNPLPEYVARIVEDLKATHHIVSVADLSPGKEWAPNPLPFSHVKYHKGELKVKQLLALVRDADVVVGGVGWITPACLATKTKLFNVLGGNGAHNGPDKIVDPRIDTGCVGFAIPDRFCRCSNMDHACDKTISNLMEQWSAFRAAQGI